MLTVTDLKKIFSAGDTQVAAVNGVSFAVATGKFVSVVGQSGSGKTTLMSLLGGLEKPTSGSIRIDDRDIAKLHDHSLIAYRGKMVGFVFQSYNLVPNLTALENVMLPMEFIGSPTRKRKRGAHPLLEQVGLSEDQMKRKPGRLSGGQQQRVAIARALANGPKLILADEPTGNLDSQTSKVIVALLRDVSRSEKTTIIVVTHDEALAKQTDEIYRLEDGKLI